MSTANYIDFTEASKTIPNRPHAATLWRWARRGVKVRGTNERIRLQHVRAGGRLLTTPEWLESFMKELAQADAAHFADASAVPAAVPAKRGERTPEQRQAAAQAAAKRLRGSAA